MRSLLASHRFSCWKRYNKKHGAIPYIILANQFVCVAWFSEQDKYAEIFETNKRMTAWLMENMEQLQDI